MKAVALAAALALTPAALAATPTPARVYAANLAFAQCMRARGVPHPDPDLKGDFTLTPSDERKMRAVGHARVEAAEEICFRRHLKDVVSTKPLSPHAKAQAIEVLAELRTCLRGYGFEAGRPVVENLTLGRAFFGFRSAPRVPPAERTRLAQAQHACEQRVRMAKRIDAIVAADRSAT